MIYLKSGQPAPVPDAVEPTLRLQLTVAFSEPGAFAGLRIAVRAGDGKRIGEEVDAKIGWNPATFTVGRSTDAWRNQEWNFQADIRLTRRELAHIEGCREKAPRHDVILIVEGRSTRFVAQYVITETENYNAPLPGPSRELETVLVHRKLNRGTGMLGPQLVSPDASGGLFQVVIEEVPKMQVIVPSSTWASDFAPPLGMGKFLVLDLPQPEDGPPGSGELPERVREASVSLEKMRVDIQKGEWTLCAQDARGVVELLNKRELIRPLLDVNGIQPATAESLLTGLQGVLEYAHAFHHRVDKPGAGAKPVPAVNAEPEDAYLAFATAAALLNLIGKKLQKSTAGP